MAKWQIQGDSLSKANPKAYGRGYLRASGPACSMLVAYDNVVLLVSRAASCRSRIEEGPRCPCTSTTLMHHISNRPHLPLLLYISVTVTATGRCPQDTLPPSFPRPHSPSPLPSLRNSLLAFIFVSTRYSARASASASASTAPTSLRSSPYPNAKIRNE